ncbi:hypothetical protein RU639_010828 [Aspergillus parasiticus]
MGVCMAVMAGCISQSSTKAAVDTAVAFIFLYVFFYVTGCVGFTYLYCSEIAPLAVRTQITFRWGGSILLSMLLLIWFCLCRWVRTENCRFDDKTTEEHKEIV